MKRNLTFNLLFDIAAASVLIFILLPLVSTIFSTTPAAFVASFQDPEVIRSIVLTFSAASVATIIALFGGIPLAYILARRHFWGKRLVEALVNLPIVIPHTAAGVALLLVFGRYGLLGGLFEKIGITFIDSFAGIVVAMLFVSIPFLVNLSRDSFALIDEEMEKVAQTDGATRWQAFFHVTLPQAWAGVLGGAVMMWARGISEFGAVVILAYHPKVVPVLVFERFEGYGLAAAQPIALFLILVAFIVFFALRLFLLPGEKKS